MWVHYGLTIMCDELVGGAPRHPEIIRRWQEARWPANGLPSNEGVPASVEEATTMTVSRLGDQALADEEMAGVWSQGYGTFTYDLNLED